MIEGNRLPPEPPPLTLVTASRLMFGGASWPAEITTLITDVAHDLAVLRCAHAHPGPVRRGTAAGGHGKRNILVVPAGDRAQGSPKYGSTVSSHSPPSVRPIATNVQPIPRHTVSPMRQFRRPANRCSQPGRTLVGCSVRAATRGVVVLSRPQSSAPGQARKAAAHPTRLVNTMCPAAAPQSSPRSAKPWRAEVSGIHHHRPALRAERDTAAADTRTEQVGEEGGLDGMVTAAPPYATATMDYDRLPRSQQQEEREHEHDLEPHSDLDHPA